MYGPNKKSERVKLWSELSNVRTQWQHPWVVGGYFNVRRFSYEKSNGGRISKGMKDFNEFIDSNELMDMPLHGSSFTWSDNRAIPTMVRLDRFLVTNGWEEQHLDAIQQTLPRLLSDHSPITLEAKGKPTIRAPFRFENFWLKLPNFTRRVEEWWQEFEVQGMACYVFGEKLKRLKQKLIGWNKEERRRAECDVTNWARRCKELDEKEEVAPLEDEEIAERKEALKRFMNFSKLEEIRWKQKAKVKWLGEGDRNTSFFHRVANGRRKRNFMSQLKEGDEFITEDTEIKEKCVNFFQRLYTETC